MRYKIGNILRGYIQFSAGSDQKAWDIGRAKFNKACPPDHGTGRQVELYASRPVPITPKYEEHDPSPEAWYPILIGYSGEPYPVKKQPPEPDPRLKTIRLEMPKVRCPYRQFSEETIGCGHPRAIRGTNCPCTMENCPLRLRWNYAKGDYTTPEDDRQEANR